MRKQGLITIILFSVIFTSGFIRKLGELDQTTENVFKEGFNGLNSASTHGTIYLDGNNATDAFFAGNTTDGLSWESAYIIENLEIKANLQGSSCIYIKNSSRYIIIRNCFFSHYQYQWDDYGIYLNNVKNVKITNSTITGNSEGLFIIESSNIIIEGNIIEENRFTGMGLGSSTNITIINNSINGNLYGLKLGSSGHNNISYNDVTNNEMSGIYLASSKNNSIYYNDASNSDQGVFAGIYLKGDSYNSSSGNIIYNNNVSFNQCGIKLGQDTLDNEIHYITANFLNTDEKFSDVWGTNSFHSIDFDGSNGEIFHSIWSTNNGTQYIYDFELDVSYSNIHVKGNYIITVKSVSKRNNIIIYDIRSNLEGYGANSLQINETDLSSTDIIDLALPIGTYSTLIITFIYSSHFFNDAIEYFLNYYEENKNNIISFNASNTTGVSITVDRSSEYDSLKSELIINEFGILEYVNTISIQRSSEMSYTIELVDVKGADGSSLLTQPTINGFYLLWFGGFGLFGMLLSLSHLNKRIKNKTIK